MVVENSEEYRNGKDLERTIKQFEDNLIKVVNPFQNIEQFTKSIKQIDSLKGKLEGINEQDFSEEELTNLYSKYHESALSILGQALRTFYTLRESESSRMLDLSAWFAKFLNVSDFEYTNAVLENTPTEYRRQELSNQIGCKTFTEDELSLLSVRALSQSEKVIKVNELIKKSFGVLYSGNNHIGPAGMDGYKEKINRLETIARPSFLGVAEVGAIGSLNDDGNSITIRGGKKWLKKAEEYASLYKEVFGRDVKINVSKEDYFRC